MECDPSRRMVLATPTDSWRLSAQVSSGILSTSSYIYTSSRVVSAWCDAESRGRPSAVPGRGLEPSLCARVETAHGLREEIPEIRGRGKFVAGSRGNVPCSLADRHVTWKGKVPHAQSRSRSKSCRMACGDFGRSGRKRGRRRSCTRSLDSYAMRTPIGTARSQVSFGP